jgi:hypothetical protein
MHRREGIYAEVFESGRRLQSSGPLLIPWKLVLVPLGDLGETVK